MHYMRFMRVDACRALPASMHTMTAQGEHCLVLAGACVALRGARVLQHQRYIGTWLMPPCIQLPGHMAHAEAAVAHEMAPMRSLYV